jgi:asparagine synthase (glutamine-hydrolysing)
MGFTFPLQKWMKEHQLISDTDNYKGKAAQNAIKQFKNDSIHWSKAFALYQVQNDG